MNGGKGIYVGGTLGLCGWPLDEIKTEDSDID
jgi:hypothetical protein